MLKKQNLTHPKAAKLATLSICSICSVLVLVLVDTQEGSVLEV